MIESFCPTLAKKKIKGLCQTRWVERHATFDTIFDLYTYLMRTWEEICSPSNCDQLYSNSRWNWNSETRSSANGLRYTSGSFEHIVAFVLSKQLLEPIAQCLQGKLQEMYFGFKKIEEVKQLYLEIRDKVDEEHTKIYGKAKKLADDIECEEKMPRIIKGRQTRPNPEVSTPTEYWRVAITIPFHDSVISEMESRFSLDKRAHYELCTLVPEVINTVSDLETTEKVLVEKWKHLMPSADNFQSELGRWKRHCSVITEEKSVTNILCKDADPVFYSNVRELLTILAVLPIGSVQAERSFSCLRQIHTWLRNRMTGDRLGNLGVQ